MYWLRKSSFPKTQKAKFQLSIDSKLKYHRDLSPAWYITQAHRMTERRKVTLKRMQDVFNLVKQLSSSGQ